MNLAGRTVFITHGAEHQRRELRSAIESKSAKWGLLYPERYQGVTVHLPMKGHGWFDLDAGQWVAQEQDPQVQLLARVEGIERRLAGIAEMLRRIGAKLEIGET